MSPRPTWIERGTDGRPYFVRKKPESSTARQILSQTLLPKLESVRSLLPTFRDSRQNRHVADAEAKTQRALPAPNTSNSTQAATPQPPAPMAPAVPPSQAQPQPMTMYLLPPQQSQNQSDPKQSNNNQANTVQPLSQFLPGPLPPGVFPFPPHPLAAQPPNVLFPPPLPFLPQYGPFTMPHSDPAQGPVHNLGQPHGAQVQVPGIHNATSAPAEMRYKCEICGRYRSARYHYRHPIPPGQSPAKTICRKCREQATDSESEETSDSDDYKGSRSRRYKSRRSARSQKHRSRSRAPRGQPRTSDRDYERYSSPSYSGSDSPNSQRPPRREERRRYRRLESPISEVIGNTRRLRLSPIGGRAYYERNQRHHNGQRVEERENRQYVSGRSRPPSRASTTGPRVLRRQYSDPFVRTARLDDPAISRHGQADDDFHTRRRERYSPQRGPSPPWMRQTSMPSHPTPGRHQQGLDGANHEHRVDRGEHQDAVLRSPSRSTRRGRSAHREVNHGYEGDYVPFSQNSESPDQILQMRAPTSTLQ